MYPRTDREFLRFSYEERIRNNGSKFERKELTGEQWMNGIEVGIVLLVLL